MFIALLWAPAMMRALVVNALILFIVSLKRDVRHGMLFHVMPFVSHMIETTVRIVAVVQLQAMVVCVMINSTIGPRIVVPSLILDQSWLHLHSAAHPIKWTPIAITWEDATMKGRNVSALI
jgi:hypothetical protein